MNPEKKMKIEHAKGVWDVILIVLFSVMMIAGCVTGFLIFLRPETSTLEKRDLEEFPEFSLSSFISGEFTDGITTWYADTYPWRDTLMNAEQTVKTVYGIQRDAITAVSDGDEIPDIPVVESTEAGAVEESAADTEDNTEVLTAENTETEEPETTEAIDGQELYNMNPQNAGAVNVKDLVGYCVYGFNLKAANIYCETVARTAELLPDVNVYDILIPNNSAIMLDDETKEEWNLPDEKKVIQYYTNYIKTLTDRVDCIQIYDALLEHNTEYLYFKTDHHWTQLAAYYTLQEFLKEQNLPVHSLSEYEKYTIQNFVGSYYTANGYQQLKENPDTIFAYVPLSTNELEFYDPSQERWRTGKIVRNLQNVQDNEKYQAFIYGDCPIEHIYNETVPAVKGRKIMVVKESFGNTFVPFLTDYYEEVIVIDYRAYDESIIDLAKEEGVTDILFINNLEAISDSNTMNVMGSICQ